MYSRYVMLRDSHGMTDYSVAVGAGIEQSTFYDWISRAKKSESAALTLPNVAKLARFFNVPIEYFAEDGN